MSLPSNGNLDRFLSRTKRRYLANLALKELAQAAVAGAGAFILLLIAGTQILDWYWPVLIFSGVLAWGAWRIRERSLSTYALAQMVDRRLDLSDRISTVVYFQSRSGSRPQGLATVEKQALERIQERDEERAAPLTMPRAALYAAGLAALALAIVGVRYGVLHTLSLSQPLANFEGSTVPEPVIADKATKSAVQQRFEEQMKQLGISVEDLEAEGMKEGKPEEMTLSAINSPEGEGTGNEKGQQSQGVKGSPDNQEGAQEGGEKGDESSAGEGGDKGEESAGESAKNGKPQSQPPGSKPGGNGANQDSSLMAKMKDALSNLMNKLGSQGQKGDPQQTAQAPAPGKGQQQQPGQKGAQGQTKAQADGEPAPDQQGDKDGDGNDKMPGNQSRAGDNNADKPGGQDAKSGMGKQDGAKEIRDAEQLAAMGKISEIFGKRAAQISGEMTVEVPAGKQQLKTAYSGRRAEHIDAGGESNRNEIPLQYQTYVQRYFEEIRKQPGKVKAQ